ncbi:hypothetical protein [Pelagicoccus mobilis]|uniref:Uncharacterized protein n=1 Tax=Pelagicoccus mobilis TaxID=415221 RepID=A0A934S1S5_9BACT|nr:hypothetical protein [Pelagicoccus mobilis]MBK1879464.1 hypothetical protein [Pelagicoccus mobilis]
MRIGIRLGKVVVFVLLLFLTLKLTSSPDCEFTRSIREAIRAYNEHGREALPELSSSEIERLLRGQVVKVRSRLRAGELEEYAGEFFHRVAGFYIVERSQRDVWLAAIDPHLWQNDLNTGYRIFSDGKGGCRRYQHLALPWPIADRHWVIDLSLGVELAEASNGTVWEYSWNLAPDGEAIAQEIVGDGKVAGLCLKDLEGAIFLPLDFGGWIAVALSPTRTLLIYHVATDVGGRIPDCWIALYAMSQLDAMLREVGELSLRAGEHYREGHELIWDGLGRPLPKIGDGGA